MISVLRQKPGFYRYLMSLSLPIVLQNLISTSLGFVDTFMVGMMGQNQAPEYPLFCGYNQ